MSLYVGCISGTSVDGLDLALLDIDGERITFVASDTHALPEDLRTSALTMGQSDQIEMDALGWLDAALGSFIAHAVNTFLNQQQKSAGDITAIGSHGQTVRHRPDDALPFTVQIGDPNRIAELTGITTVADFRRRDVAAGGQGAPMVPPFHQALFSPALDTTERTTVVLNVGGISNVTQLNRSALIGFDTGPGNCLLDSWCARHTGAEYDEKGNWARTGKVSESLLERLLSDSYFSRAAPKSTGREYFNLPWLDERLAPDLEPADVQATLVELTARCTLDALGTLEVEQMIVCGGGRHNLLLLERLNALSKTLVQTAEDRGVDGDAIEAGAFAWLAARTLAKLPGNSPTVTGADGPRILGGIYLG